MSFSDTGGDIENHSQGDSGRDSDESVSKSITKLKIVSAEKNRKHFSTRKNSAKNPVGRFNVSRYAKRGRHCTKINKSRKPKEIKTGKKSTGKSQDRLENAVEVNTTFWQRGKRCRLGGKAKGMPPEEETCDKCDSDEESDNCYFSRISLGYFQKFKDKSGASTSYELEVTQKSQSPLLTRTGELLDKTSEEMELLELQQWGKMNLVPSKGAARMNIAEDIDPDTF